MADAADTRRNAGRVEKEVVECRRCGKPTEVLAEHAGLPALCDECINEMLGIYDVLRGSDEE
ncbi:MAG: hypothetical protein ACXQTZ_00445 [Candidatus Alkanophagales archaeon]